MRERESDSWETLSLRRRSWCFYGPSLGSFAPGGRGFRAGRRPWVYGVISVILLVVGISMLPDDPDGTTNEPERLAEALAYLNEIDDVTWVEVDSNNAYLGFASVPEDLALIVNAAAMNGNEVLGFGVHVWAVQADLGWRPGQPGLLCEATARGGQFENTCEP